MSVHYIIDGYNVLHSTMKWNHLPRAQQREQFLLYLDQHPLTRQARNSMTVVLDGYAAALKDIRLSSVRLLFSGDRDADTAIKQKVSDSTNPRDLIIVSNDRAVRSAVKALGARVITCEEFFLLDKKKEPSPSRRKLDDQSAQKINEELKRLWKLD